MLPLPEIVANLKAFPRSRLVLPHHQFKSVRFKPPATTASSLLSDVANFFQHVDQPAARTVSCKVTFPLSGA